MPSFYEFFAGGGMVRAGLGKEWACLFANDFDRKKASAYEENWGNEELIVGDVGALTSDQLLGQADLAWASFPCQDLSLAGGGAGLNGQRSGTFWPFWDLMGDLASQGRGPKIIALENVCGALTSRDGQDFAAIAQAFASRRYRFGAVVLDAKDFVPQSRQRLFIIGVRDDVEIPEELAIEEPTGNYHTKRLMIAHANLDRSVAKNWIWWKLPQPPLRKNGLSDLIENSVHESAWHTDKETRRLLSLMSPINAKKVTDAQRTGELTIGCVYKRTRRNSENERVQRAEIRFDDVSGCLRTPGGGSSRQLIVVVKGKSIRSRLITARETARLMGLSDEFQLPSNYNEAYYLTGDGVVVPVVRHLARHILEPLVRAAKRGALRSDNVISEAA